MTRPAAELRDALDAVGAMPDGQAKSAAAERVLAEIDAADAAELLPAALHTLVRAYNYGGEPEKLLVPFSRSLRLYDERPELFEADLQQVRLLWSFKWVTLRIWQFPTVPRAQVDGILDEMGRRYALAGATPHAVLHRRWCWALGRGDTAAAVELAERCRVAPVDGYSDNDAYVNTVGWHAITLGDDEAAIRALEPEFKDGDPDAASLADALLPLLRLGRHDEARDAHLRGMSRRRGRPANELQTGQHLAFLALTGNEARGLELLAASPKLLGDASSPWGRQYYLDGAGLLLRRVTDLGSGGTPLAGPDGPTTAAELADWVAGEAFALAGAFDARNGTDYYTTRTRETLAAEPLVDHLPLTVDRPAGRATGGTP